jgi:hypothetical protein
LVGRPVGKLQLDCLREGDGRITLRQILGKEVERMEGAWNWLRIMSNGRLWY